MEFLQENQFGMLDLDDLVDFEQANDIKFPDDYRQFLLIINGGIPVSNKVKFDNTITDIKYLFGMHRGPYYSNFFDHVEMFANRIPSWYVPIGNDSGGNLFIMSLWDENKGVVAFWRHEMEAPLGQADGYFDNLSKVADSFTDFLNNALDSDR